MLYREIIAVGSEIHTKHINTLCGQNVEFVNVKPCGAYSNHWALNRSLTKEICKIFVENLIVVQLFSELLQCYPFKDEAYLFYIRTQCVPRCKHSSLRL
jgi:hypothetical protein